MKTYLALDVGGSSIKYALIQEDSTILEKSSVPTPMDTMDHFVETKIVLKVWLFLCQVLSILK